MSYELKEYLNAINFTKKDLMKSEDKLWEKKYPAFIVNKILSGFSDTIMFVNEMNRNHFLDKDMQFQLILGEYIKSGLCFIITISIILFYTLNIF